MTINGSAAHLNNQYEFDVLCAQKSIEIFDEALKIGAFPTRTNLFINLLGELICFPFYLGLKTLSASYHLFSFLLVNSHYKKQALNAGRLLHLFFLSSVQLLCPFICTAIRMSSSLLGFFFPKWALKGWLLAEKGEQYSHQLIARHWETSIVASQASSQRDIRPTNALFYLGWHQTHELAHGSVLPMQKQSLEETLHVEFPSFLHLILQGDARDKDTLLAIEPDLIKPVPSFFDPLSLHPSATTLIKFKELAQTWKGKLEDKWMEKSSETLTIEEMQQLFYYLNSKLESGCLKNTPGLNREALNFQINLLKNLFSCYLKFGRASFPA